MTIFVLMLSCLGFSSGHLTAEQVESSQPSVSRLLKQLDADNYQTREAAAEQLVGKGVQALKPMVLHSFSSSPESSWRIRSVIEKIGIAGNEDTFFKSTGVLRLLYPLDDASTSERLESLRQQWRLARKKNAIKRLQELGATISDPYRGQTATVAALGWQMANGGRAIGERVQQQRLVAKVGTESKKITVANSVTKRKSLTRRELIERVDELLESDLVTNRERIFGSDEPDGLEQNVDPQQAVQFRNIDPFAANALRINQIRSGAMALFDNNYRGTAEDLKLLQDIPNLTLIHWKDRPLDAIELEAAHKIASVRRVHFENCTFPDDPLPKSAWPRLATHFEFINQTIPVSTIERLKGSNVNSLKFSNCKASAILHKQLRQIGSLSQLALEETLVDEQWFETFESVGSLTRVDLTLCKFDPAEYRKLTRLRPHLLINFTPQAFIGIRSPDIGGVNVRRARMIARMRAAQQAKPGQKIADPEFPEFELPANGAGCTISDVVSGSGAEKAGLKAGDVIEKIDGQPITIFEDIRLIVAQHRAGDKLNVQFNRAGESKKATIELGSYAKSVAAIE